ncbi:MAG: flippase-like domain-containing protein [Thaumarchaeota archaeon]|nr:flippase-like domain-containing protein [Nitrososphaerota archaeon]
MNGLDLIKGNIIWIVLGSLIFYVVLILFSDASKISDHFFHIRIELIFLIFLLGILSHIIKSFRQKDFLQMIDEKIPFKKNLIIYLAGLSLITTPGGIGTFIKSKYLKHKFGIPNNKSISVIFLERYHDLLATTTIILISFSISFSWISATLVIISSFLLILVYLLIRNMKTFSFVHNKLLKIKFIAKRLPEVGPDESFFVLTRANAMTKGWLISIGAWSLDSLAVYIGFLAFNVDLGYLLTSQIYFTSLGYGILSLIPGGIGVTEGMADYLLVNQGLDLSIASSLVIFTRLTTLWFATIIGVIFTRYALKQKVNL